MATGSEIEYLIEYIKYNPNIKPYEIADAMGNMYPTLKFHFVPKKNNNDEMAIIKMYKYLLEFDLVEGRLSPMNELIMQPFILTPLGDDLAAGKIDMTNVFEISSKEYINFTYNFNKRILENNYFRAFALLTIVNTILLIILILKG